MNKKLLFAALSLAAFTACTDDSFESQKQLAEEAIPVEFELINGDATRAHMDEENGTAVIWSSDDKDLFTLYFGNQDGFGDQAAGPWTTGYDNATYQAVSDGQTAGLATPTMIKPGAAIMVWPSDTTFRITTDRPLSLVIPAEQNDIVNNLPYTSDLINIQPYIINQGEATERPSTAADPNRAGYNRKYPVYMRAMGSQLNLKPNYEGQDKIDELTSLEEDPIDPITIDNIQLITADGGDTEFTTEVPLTFANANAAWDLAHHPERAWMKVTTMDYDNAIATTDMLTSTCFDADRGICKFLFLPQPIMETEGEGVEDAAIIVNTYYGQVVVADDNHGGLYGTTPGKPEELQNAWYRFATANTQADAEALLEDGETLGAKQAADAVDGAGKWMIKSAPEFGMKQTINWFTNHKGTGTVLNEPNGGATTRYLNVNLAYLDMSNLHIKTDKQLRDVVRVWQKLGLLSVTVYLDGDANGVFKTTQKTIETINAMNAQAAAGKVFTVTPCNKDGEVCNQILVTESSELPEIQNMTFIVVKDGDANSHKADVVLNAGESWKWDGTVMVAPDATTGINQIINKGTMANRVDQTLNILSATTPAIVSSNITFVNDGVWTIAAGKEVKVQNAVINNGTLNIGKEAQYLQDGANLGAQSIFTNEATSLPTDFGGTGEFGKVNNKGVFAVIGIGKINNYGLIEHANKNAKTYITTNQTPGADFTLPFSNVENEENKIGRINLPYSNKDEDNISVKAALEEGFVSVTIDGEVTGQLNNTSLGNKVNYVIIKSGVTEIANLNPENNPQQVKYLEINKTDRKEIAWTVETNTEFTGLMVLSDVNIKIFTQVTAAVTYLKSNSKMYVGGVFNRYAVGEGQDAIAATDWAGYYGNTEGNVGTNYITFE